jgi:4'-phosphopantetheinyl transferase
MFIQAEPLILDHQIHVWCIDLNQNSDQILLLNRSLAASERHRAAKFINPLHRDRWIVARGYLRHILSHYLDLTPEQIVFNYSDRGKPSIPDYELQFNLSHAHDRAVYGIHAKFPIGIDIEHLHPIAATPLVDRFFSPTERAIFHSLPPSSHQAAFFHAWTQKEAYLKACGTGLSIPLDQIEVSIDPSTPVQIITTPDPQPHPWQIQQLILPPGYVGSIVIGGEYTGIEYIN